MNEIYFDQALIYFKNKNWECIKDTETFTEYRKKEILDGVPVYFTLSFHKKAKRIGLYFGLEEKKDAARFEMEKNVSFDDIMMIIEDIYEFKDKKEALFDFFKNSDVEINSVDAISSIDINNLSDSVKLEPPKETV